MKKFYSFVLMAMMLLVGTNAWANYPAGWLQQQFDNIPADGQTHTIVMENDIVLTDPVYLGTATVDEDRKSIILDMNGHHITMDATTWVSTKGNVFCSMFTITHGELLIRNNNKSVTSTISMTGKGYDYIGSDSKRYLAQYNNIFNVAGSYKSSRWVKSGNTYEIDENAAINTRDKGWFTHLEIGEGVKVVAENTIYGAGISIDGYYTNYHAMISPDAVPASGAPTGVFGTSGLTGATKGNVCLYNRSDAPAYNTAILSKASEGVAYGVRVDVYGDIEFATAATEGKAYGIKLNGGLRSSLRENEIFQNQYCWKMDEAYARTYGATEAPTTNATKSFVIGETAYNNHYNDTVDAPFLYIHSTAHIIAAAELNEATAVYCSGYGKTFIEGACSGNSGVNVKSGTVELHDAEITCTATATSVYAAENGNNATGTGAVVVNSVDERAGGIEVIISGDSKVSTDYGYAIAETVTANNDGTKVTSIVIEGGTIQGGAATGTTGGGAILVSETTKDNDDAEVVIYGANLTGNNKVEVGEGTLTDLLPKNERTSEPEGHVTPVLDPVTGKTTLVISAGAAPDPGNKVSNQATDASVKWQGPDVTDEITASINEDHLLRLTELQINDTITAAEDEASEDPAIVSGQPRTQTLYIRNGATLEVKRVILGPAARIIVEAGGKLIVNGTQGISAPSTQNIVLRSTADKQAYFLFNPAVSSNKHPNASVVVSTVCRQTGYSPWTYVYQRIASPLKDTLTAAPANDFGNDMTKLYTADATNVAFENYLYHWDMAQEKWIVGPWNQMAPFTGYQLANNSQAGGVKYTFSGKLVGNQDGNYQFAGEGFDFFGNSYTAPIYIKNIFDHFNNVGVQAAVWIYDYEAGNYIAITPDDFDGGHFPIWLHGNNLPLKEIAPFAGFIMKLDDATNGNVAKLNYAAAIWGNPDVNPSAAAPARHSQETADRVTLRVDAANGKADMIKLVQSDRFSEAFDNGADASKYFSENGVNLYAVTNDGELARVATNDLENTVLAFQAGNATEYTISVPAQSGETFMLRDLVTNQTMLMTAGSTYTFNQEAYSTNNARFEIVAAAKMPTAIDNTEVKANVKGIYTITGQYVGENFEILPAGVYVVNGVKIVK